MYQCKLCITPQSDLSPTISVTSCVDVAKANAGF